MFLYRHALELYIKAIILTGNDILILSNQNPLVESKDLGSHRLYSLIPAIKQIFCFLGWTSDFEIPGMKDLNDFEKFLQNIEKIDPNSFSFRYPTTKKGDAALPEHFSFNVLELCQQLDPILDLLEGADMGLKEEWDVRAEAAFEAQQFN